MVHFISAMLFAPGHGGCYIISRVGIEYVLMWFERNVMYSVCIRFECSGLSRMGFQKKTNIWIRGWVGGLSSIQFFFGFLEFF